MYPDQTMPPFLIIIINVPMIPTLAACRQPDGESGVAKIRNQKHENAKTKKARHRNTKKIPNTDSQASHMAYRVAKLEQL